MVNIVHQRTLAFFYIVAFSLVLAAICGKEWIVDERKDTTGILGNKNGHYIATISLWSYYDWKENSFDIADLYNDCDFRRHGIQSVRGFLILGLITIVVQFAFFLYSMFDREKNARKQLLGLRVLQALHAWATFCVFISFSIFAGIAEKECNGIEMVSRYSDYGWCFAFVVSIFVLFGFQLIALVLTPSTYFRVGKKYSVGDTASATTEPTSLNTTPAVTGGVGPTVPANSGGWIPIGSTPPEAPSATPGSVPASHDPIISPATTHASGAPLV